MQDELLCRIKYRMKKQKKEKQKAEQNRAKQNRAQTSSIDLFIAISIFTVLFVLVILAWNSYAAALSTRLDSAETELKAFQLSELLLKTPGYPGMWEKLENSSGIIELGLAEKPNALSREKAIRLTDSAFLNKSSIRDTLNINLYNFTIIITDTSGNIKYENGNPLSAGDSLPAAKKNVVILKRAALYETENAILKIVLWKK